MNFILAKLVIPEFAICQPFGAEHLYQMAVSGFSELRRLNQSSRYLLIIGDGVYAIWYCVLMKATLIFRDKVVFADGAVLEMVLWRLPNKSNERPHAIKYRLHYGLSGHTLVRYDNEAGKGDHRHKGGREEPYQFVDVETLQADFIRDVEEIRGERLE